MRWHRDSFHDSSGCCVCRYDSTGREELSVAQFMMQVGIEVSGRDWTASGSGEVTSRASSEWCGVLCVAVPQFLFL